MTLSCTFWGVRGSVPVPGPSTTRYGGNTPCLELRHGERRLLLDAGTGIAAWSRATPRAGDVSILVTHTHWDHIQGLPFLESLHEVDRRVRVTGPRPGALTLQRALEHLLAPAHFPVGAADLRGRLEVTEVEALSKLEVNGFRVETVAVRHPIPTLGYRVSAGIGTPALTYLSDNELGAMEPPDEALVRFVHGSRVLVHDAMISDDSWPSRIGWGHSTPLQAVRLAAAAQVEELVLNHFDPSDDDDRLDRVSESVSRHVASTAPALRVTMAREGRTITLD